MSLKNLQPRAANLESSKIITLCQKIAPEHQAIYLKVEPSNASIINECYENVAQIIKQKGGAIQYGWQIWETLPEIMAEAEFHAVWKDSDGNYHDITPKEIPEITEILFLPDSKRTYLGRQVDNIRIALKDDPLIDAFIKNAESYFEVMNRGELANYHGELIATPEMIQLKQQQEEIFAAMIQKFFI